MRCSLLHHFFASSLDSTKERSVERWSFSDIKPPSICSSPSPHFAAFFLLSLFRFLLPNALSDSCPFHYFILFFLYAGYWSSVSSTHFCIPNSFHSSFKPQITKHWNIIHLCFSNKLRSTKFFKFQQTNWPLPKCSPYASNFTASFDYAIYIFYCKSTRSTNQYLASQLQWNIRRTTQVLQYSVYRFSLRYLRPHFLWYASFQDKKLPE